jgi:RNA polymerase sigma factor (sigma-70 family)
MVLGVCRSVLRNRHDADDAFQATFLVLANRAHAIRRRDGLASWLHGVARRVSLQARSKASRRRKREADVLSNAPTARPPVDDLSWGEVRRIVHAEVAALPQRFREPLVLCYLEGLTQEEVASRLNWPVTTVKGRLQRGRHRLRFRLERRGLALAAGLTAVLTSQTLAASVPAGLMAATARAAAHFLTPIMKTSQATLLAQSVLQETGKLSWKAITTVVLAVGITAGGLGLAVGYQPSAQEKPQDAERKPPADPPKPVQQIAKVNSKMDELGDPLPEGAVARLGSLRFNHGDGLSNIRFSSDGKTVFSFGGGICRLWEAATGKQLGQSAWGQPHWEDDVVVQPDGKTLIAVGQETFGDTLRVWDIAQGKEISTARLQVKRGGWSIDRRNKLSPDGKLAIIHTPSRVHVFDVESARELCTLPKDGKEIRTVGFAGTGQVVTASSDRTIDVWEAKSGKAIRSFKCDAPVELIFASPDGHLLATLEHHTNFIDKIPEKDVIRIWNVDKGVETHQLAAPSKHWYHSVLFTPDSKGLVSNSSAGNAGEVTLWNAQTGERVLESKDTVGSHLAISPDGTRLAAGSNWGKFAMVDLKTGKRLLGEASLDLPTAAVSLTPHGERVIGTGYQSITSWEVATGRRIHFLETPGDWPVDPYHVHSPDGRYALNMSRHDNPDETHVAVWDMTTASLHTLPFPGKWLQLATAYSPDSTRLAIWQPGEQTVVRFWDLRTGKETHSFKETKAGWPGHLFFTPDGKTLIVAGKRTVGYDAASGEEVFSWRIEPLPDNSGTVIAAGGGAPADPQQRNPFRRFVVSPEGTLAAGVFDSGFSRKPLSDRIVLVEATTGRIVRRWSDSGKPSNGYEELAFSPDGRLLASADDKVVHLWEVATGKELWTFQGHRGEIRSLAFSQDGRRLASASNDSTVLVWDLVATSPSQSLDDKALAGLWTDLAGDDARVAHAAVWRMMQPPKTTLPWLRQKLRPVGEPDMKKISQDIKDLDSEAFEVREKADKELNALGEAPMPALREALAKNPSPEMRRRLESHLDRAPHFVMNPARLQCLRALNALEQIGSSDARRLLTDLAAGAGYALETQEAKAALRRLDALAKQ